MSSEQAYEPELIDQTRQHIRGLVREIEELGKSQTSPAEFYEGFLHRIVAALAAIGGAVWTLDDEGKLALTSQVNLGETRLHESEDDQRRHGKLLRKTLTAGEGTLIQPGYVVAEEDIGNPTDSLLIFGILKADQEVRGLVEIFQRGGGRAATERGYLRFVVQMCQVAEDYLKTRQLRLYTDRQAIWTQLEQFTRNAHASLEPRVTAYAIANEGRRLIECDRVSVAIRKGYSCRIEAVSGQETFDKRSNTVTLLGKLASVVVKAGEPLWYTGDTRDLAPQVEEALEAYVDDSHSKTIVILPLVKPTEEEEHEKDHHRKPEYLGALVIEQINTDGIPTAMQRRIDVVSEHSSVALANSLEHNSLFLMPVWRTLGKSRWVVSARTLPKTIAIAIVLVGVLLSLFLIPANFQLHGKGTLEPLMKRDVFSAVEGTVTKVLVKHDEEVKQGQTLLEMRDTNTDVGYTKALGDVAANNATIQGLQQSIFSSPPEERRRKEEELNRAMAARKSLEKQLELYEEKKEKLIVRSPIDGKVITWQPEERLINRTVDKGTVLLTVADPKQGWELEVHMPEDRMGHIKRAQKQMGDDLDVSYVLSTDPGKWLHGKISEVHQAAEVQGEEGNTVLVRVKIDNNDIGEADRKGESVQAKINCGRRSLGYAWLHDVFEFIQSKILFRW